MTTAIVALSAVVCVLALILAFTIRTQRVERAEWTHERRQLVDRAIARHTGEVIALDRNEQRAPKPTEPERLIEGLS